MRIFSYLRNTFLEEAGHWVIWLPVIFSVGILLYFSLDFEPSPILSYAPFLAASAAVIAALRRPVLRSIFIIILLIAGGFAATEFRTENAVAPKIREETKLTVSGNIEDIAYNDEVPKITLRNSRSDRLWMR